MGHWFPKIVTAVFDTIIEKMDDAFSKDRPWSKKIHLKVL